MHGTADPSFFQNWIPFGIVGLSLQLAFGAIRAALAR
jgi:hypothetical protein